MLLLLQSERSKDLFSKVNILPTHAAKKGNHFDWLVVQNYVDKGSVYCFLLCFLLLRHDPKFFCYLNPLLLVRSIHYIIYLFILLQSICCPKFKHFEWLVVENYLDPFCHYPNPGIMVVHNNREFKRYCWITIMK